MFPAAALLPILLSPVASFFQPGSQFHWLTYVGATLLAAALLLIRRRRSFRLRALLRHLLPARLVRHRSTRLDLQLLVIGSLFGVLQAPLLFGALALGKAAILRGVTGWLGAGEAVGSPSVAVTGATVLLTFLAIEFGYWLAHYAMHRVPALWEFHKVHHSAEVLTPLTEWRQHPVEWALFPVSIGLCVAAVQTPLLHVFGPGAQLIDPRATNVLLLGFMFSALHLRHSELPFAATGWLGRLIQSPGHHQIHHSVAPEHHNRNLGFCLSLWDWAFGTLCLPEKGRRYELGLGEEDAALTTASGSVVAPVWRAVRGLVPGRSAEPPPPPLRGALEREGRA